MSTPCSGIVSRTSCRSSWRQNWTQHWAMRRIRKAIWITANKRNGHSSKKLKSQYVEFQIDVPRDRGGEFEPKIVPKYQRDVCGIEEKVISLYGRGMSTRDIHDQLQDIYGIEMSAEMVSKITDKITLSTHPNIL